MKKMNLVGLAAVITLLTVLVFSGGQNVLHTESTEQTATAKTTVTNNEKEAEATNSFDSSENQKHQLKHDQIVSLTNRFMEELVQPTDKWYRVTNYETKAAFIEDFTRISSQSVAEKYINTYYVQEEDGLYVIPTSTPPWFVKEQNYETERLADNKVKVIQQNTSDLYGEYTIELEFTFDNEWKITNTEHF